MPQPQVQEREATVEDLIEAYANDFGIPPSLALAVARKESGMKSDAVGDSGLKRGPSIGLFQLSPPAAQDMGVDPSDPIQNIYGGVKYLKTLSDQFNGDIEHILMAYNGGAENVKKNTVSPEAQAYAADVIANLSATMRQDVTPMPKTAPDAALPAMAPVASHGEAKPSEYPHARVGRWVTETAKALVPAERTGPLAGAMVGGIRGAQLGAPMGPTAAALGGIAGVGVGAFGGEAIQMGLEKLGEWFGLTEPSRPVTIRDVAGKLSWAANTAMMGQMLGEIGVRVLSPIAARVMAPVAHKMSTYAREALATFPPKAVLPSEVSESRMLNIAENIAEGSILGGAKVSGVKEARQGLAQSKVFQALDDLSVPVESKAAGVGVQAARKAAVRQFRTSENQAWKVFEKEAENIPVKTPQLDAFIGELQGKEATAILPNAGAEAARRISRMANEGDAAEHLLLGDYAGMSEAHKDLIRAQINTGPPMTAPAFQKTVSDLGKLTRALEQSAAKDPSKYNAQYGAAKRLLSLAREDLRNSLQGNPTAVAAYESASEVSRLGNERLFNKAVRDVAKAAPEQIVAKLLKPNNSTAIGLVTDAVGDEAMQPIRRLALEKLAPANPKTGQIEWGNVASQLQGLGDDTLKSLFPGGHAEELQRLSRLMLNMRRQPAGTIGKVGIFLTQWGPFIGIASGNLPPSAGLTLGIPWVMSHIMASPTGLKWLTTGLRAPLGSEQAIRAGAMLTAFLKNQLPIEPVPSHETPP